MVSSVDKDEKKRTLWMEAVYNLFIDVFYLWMEAVMKALLWSLALEASLCCVVL